jgi:hypothetical protein
MHLLQKLLYYLILVVLSCMVEDYGDFRIALIVSIVAVEIVLYRLQRTHPRLGRPWMAPLFALVLAVALLLLTSTIKLIIERLEQ